MQPKSDASSFEENDIRHTRIVLTYARKEVDGNQTIELVIPVYQKYSAARPGTVTPIAAVAACSVNPRSPGPTPSSISRLSQ